MHPAEVHIFFFGSVTNLGHRSIFFRCNRITGHDGPKIWAVTKEVKSGSRLKMSSVWPKSFLGWTRTSVHRSRREQWTPCFSFFLMILQLRTFENFGLNYRQFGDRLRIRILSTASTTTARLLHSSQATTMNRIPKIHQESSVAVEFFSRSIVIIYPIE